MKMEHRYPNNIAAIRKKYGLTQKELATRCEINVSALCRYEKGDLKVPKDKLTRIAQELEIPYFALDPATSSAVLDCSACGQIPKRYYSNGKYLYKCPWCGLGAAEDPDPVDALILWNAKISREKYIED